MYKALFVLSDVRCGSTYASELIAYNASQYHGMELWALPKEPFQAITNHTSPAELVSAFDSLWVNPHGWRSGMIKCAHLSIINKLSAESDALQERFFGSSAFWVVIRRDDVFARAVSLAYALHTGRFHEYENNDNSTGSPGISHEQIRECLKMVIYSDTFLTACLPSFANVMEANYQDIMRNENEFVNTVGTFAFGHSLIEGGNAVVKPKIQRNDRADKQRLREEFVTRFTREFHRNNPRHAVA